MPSFYVPQSVDMNHKLVSNENKGLTKEKGKMGIFEEMKDRFRDFDKFSKDEQKKLLELFRLGNKCIDERINEVLKGKEYPYIFEEDLENYRKSAHKMLLIHKHELNLSKDEFKETIRKWLDNDLSSIDDQYKQMYPRTRFFPSPVPSSVRG